MLGLMAQSWVSNSCREADAATAAFQPPPCSKAQRTSSSCQVGVHRKTDPAPLSLHWAPFTQCPDCGCECQWGPGEAGDRQCGCQPDP